MEKKHHKDDGHLKYMLCHDGSDASQNALKTLRDGYMKREDDHLIVAHVFTQSKEEYLTLKFRKDYIK